MQSSPSHLATKERYPTRGGFFVHPDARTIIALIACTGLFLFFACFRVQEPGLEYDEVLFANAALGNLDGSFLAYALRIGHRTVPVMLMPYIGAVKAWIYAFIFTVAPISPATVRLPMIFLGVVTLVATYLFAVTLFNRTTGFITVTLLSTDPVFIFQSRMDWGPIAIMMLLKMGSLYLFARFIETRRILVLAAASFCLGLGVYDKVNFAWYVLALPFAAILAWRAQCLQFVNRKTISVFVLAFLLGCWPLVVYNLVRPGATFKGQLESHRTLTQTLRNQTYLITATFSGRGTYQYVNGESLETTVKQYNQTLARFIPHNTFTLDVFIISLLGLPLFRKRPRELSALIFIVALLLLIAVQIYFTPHATGPHHVMMLYPFPHMVIGFMLSGLLTNTSIFGRRLWKSIGLTLLSVLVVTNIGVDSGYLLGLTTVGGSGVWSDAIYDLEDYTQQAKTQDYFLMDWGFNTQLLLLSHGGIHKTEIFWNLLDPKNEIALARSLYVMQLRQPTAFVFHSPKYTAFDEPRRIFDRMLTQNHLSSKVIKTFRQRNGDVVYVVEKVEPAVP